MISVIKLIKRCYPFLVSRALVAQPSSVPSWELVGNPDLDRFEQEIQSISVSPGRIT